MKKILLLIICLFIVTGCDATYDLEIYKGTFKEDISGIEEDKLLWDKKEENSQSYRELIQEEYNRDNFYYEKKLIDTEEELSLNYKGEFTLEEFDASSVVRRCYDHVSILEEENYIVLSTSMTNTCFEQYPILETLTINIKTNHKVETENADSKKNHTYTWVVNTENYKDKSIQLKLYKDKYVWNYNNSALKTALLIIFIIGGTVLVVSKVYKVYKEKENL